MKNKSALCSVVFMVLTSLGCTTIIKYDLSDLSAASVNTKRQEMKVAVAPFSDFRPEQEKNPPSSSVFLSGKIEVRDSMFKGGDVPHNLSEAIVTHFNHVQLFKDAEVVDHAAAIPSPDVLERMQRLGYAMLLTGQIKRFYGVGYATTFDKVAIALAIIPITAVVTLPIMLIQQNDNEGFVEIIDVQLTETSSGGVVWSGSFSKQKHLRYNDAYPADAASDTLKEIVKEMVTQIEAVNFQ